MTKNDVTSIIISMMRAAQIDPETHVKVDKDDDDHLVNNADKNDENGNLMENNNDIPAGDENVVDNIEVEAAVENKEGEELANDLTNIQWDMDEAMEDNNPMVRDIFLPGPSTLNVGMDEIPIKNVQFSLEELDPEFIF